METNPVPAGAAVAITVLSPDPSPPIAGRILDFIGTSMTISAREPIPPGSAVKIESDDALLLGEVFQAKENEITVKISEALNSLSELRRLNRALLGTDRESDPERIEPIAHPVRTTSS
jgi:hypothetical protein